MNTGELKTYIVNVLKTNKELYQEFLANAENPNDIGEEFWNRTKKCKIKTQDDLELALHFAETAAGDKSFGAYLSVPAIGYTVRTFLHKEMSAVFFITTDLTDSEVIGYFFQQD